MILRIYKVKTKSGNIWVPSGIAVKRTHAAGNIAYHTSFCGWGGSFPTRKEAWQFAWQALKSYLVETLGL